MTLLSHAQNFEDVLLWRSLKHIVNGRYLDIGAQDPIIDSVSKGFYLLGWRGIHVEATPFYAAALRADRPDEMVIEAAVADEPGPLSFFNVTETGLSTGCADLAREYSASGREVKLISVSTISLSEVLDKFEGQDIHWMKIDVEQMEASVLRSWGDSQIRPWILVIESTYPLSQKQTHEEWINLVLNRGYDEAGFDGLNRYFISKDHSYLLKNFTTPPNVFDLFNVSPNHFTARHITSNHNEALALCNQLLVQSKQKQDELRDQCFANKATADEVVAVLAERNQQLLDLKAEHQRAKEAIIDALEARDSSQIALREAESVIVVIKADLERKLEHLVEMAEACNKAENSLQLTVAALDKTNDLNSQLLKSNHIEKRVLLDAHTQALTEWRNAYNAVCVKLESALQNVDAAIRGTAHLEREKAQLDTEVTRLSSRLADMRHAFAKERSKNKNYIDCIEQENSELKNKVIQYKYLCKQLENSEKNSQEFKWALMSSVFFKYSVRLIFKKNSKVRGFLEARNGNDSFSEELSINQEMSASEMLLNEKSLSGVRRAASFEELSSLDGMDFVQSAYVTLFNRYPDADGALYYRGRLAAGYAKIQILDQMASSEEYRRANPFLPGLGAALKKHKRSGNLIWRWFYRLSGYTESNSLEDRRWRMLLHEISALRLEIGRGLQQFEASWQRTEDAAGPNSVSANVISAQSDPADVDRSHEVSISPQSAPSNDGTQIGRKPVLDGDVTHLIESGDHPDLSSKVRKVIGLFARHIEFKAVQS